MNNENESQEKNISSSEQVKETVSGNDVPHLVSSLDGPSPLTTYDSVNTNAPVVTASIIEERLAKIKGTMAERSSRPRPPAESARSDSAGASIPPGEPSRDNNSSRPKEAASRSARPNRPHDGEETGRKDSRPEKKSRLVVETVHFTDRVPIPNMRGRSDDIEHELDELFQDQSIEELFRNVDAVAGQELLEEGSKVQARVLAVLRDSVVVELGGREQGLIPLKQFPEGENPNVGQMLEGVVTRYNKEEGLYEISLPLAAAEVGDWNSISTGMIVETRIVGVNKGGLDCEIGKLRAFLPVGQVAIHRVENIELLVGERWKVIVTEVNPQRRNLIVSRRALLEQEREELRDKLWGELEVGQVREGVVRKLIEVGAFVDLGGLDGFIHVSAMSWGRINHPNEVLKEGERIRVTIQKIDRESQRLSLSYKDSSLDPWKDIAERFQPGQQVRGKVTNLMTFGAFVELVPGVEGLVHISEIAYQHVKTVSDALQSGDWVDALILAIDAEHRKMSLSIKQLGPKPKSKEELQEESQQTAVAQQEAKENAEAEERLKRVSKNQFKGELKGGVTSANDDSNKFGLNW